MVVIKHGFGNIIMFTVFNITIYNVISLIDRYIVCFSLCSR